MRQLPLLRRTLSVMTSTVVPLPGSPPAHDSGAKSCLRSNTEPGPLLHSLSPASPVPIPRNGVDYRNKIVLAPMVRSGELPCRLLALHYGADLVWGPETVDRAMIGTTMHTNPRTGCLEWSRLSRSNNTKVDHSKATKESIIYRIDPDREQGRLIYQIGTGTPSLAVAAASLVAPHVAGIDVNAGCPKPFSTTGGMGAALLRDPDRLASILTALVTEVGIRHEIGISVKIRLLETPEQTSALVHKLCSTGITGLTVHCRTTPMRPRERAIRQQLSMISSICHHHGVACLMNGDVASRDEGITLAKQYDCDGSMLATAVEPNPSVFRPHSSGGPLSWPEVVKQYLHFALSVENKWGNSKFTISQIMPGRYPRYQAVQMSKSYSEAISVLDLDSFDPTLIAEAEKVDRILGLDVPRLSKNDLKRERKAYEQERKQMKEEPSVGQANGELLGGEKRKKRRSLQQQQPGTFDYNSGDAATGFALPRQEQMAAVVV